MRRNPACIPAEACTPRSWAACTLVTGACTLGAETCTRPSWTCKNRVKACKSPDETCTPLCVTPGACTLSWTPGPGMRGWRPWCSGRVRWLRCHQSHTPPPGPGPRARAP